MEIYGWPWFLPICGLIAGSVIGFVARHQHFCTMSALERRWYANDSSGVRTWGLAIAVAMLCTQLLYHSGRVNLDASFYLSSNFAWTGAIIGGLLFGVGMALVGTCGFGALVRLGGGSLRSLVVILVLGITALAAQRGLFALVRLQLVDRMALDMSFAGDQSLGSVASALTGMNLHFIIPAAVITFLFWWVFSDFSYRQNRGMIAAGIVLGTAIPFGWLVTTLASANSFSPVQIESTSFVSPVADTLLHLVTVTGELPDYGVGLIIGVVLGAAACAWQRRDVRWEACDDARELSRHLAGGALMGIGGIFASGCTIGQGISAMSTLAISAPLALISIVIGAKLGLIYLIEGVRGLNPHPSNSR